MSDALEAATRQAKDAKHEATPASADEVSAGDMSTREAPGGPKRTVKGPRAVRGPGTGFVASLALVALLVIVIAWTRC